MTEAETFPERPVVEQQQGVHPVVKQEQDEE